jgi:hypothetical protein
LIEFELDLLLWAISPTFYEQLYCPFLSPKKLQTQAVNTEKAAQLTFAQKTVNLLNVREIDTYVQFHQRFTYM